MKLSDPVHIYFTLQQRIKLGLDNGLRGMGLGYGYEWRVDMKQDMKNGRLRLKVTILKGGIIFPIPLSKHSLSPYVSRGFFSIFIFFVIF